MPIAAAFAPNYTFKDVLIAMKFLLPWNAKKMQGGTAIAKFEEKFRDYMDAEKAVSFDSGRSGLYAILKAMDIQEGDEILLQAFTTVALPNTIHLFGAKPVFVDIGESTYNIDPQKIEEKISAKTKAIIIQHTFGNPADMDAILEVVKRHDLKIIEDCAHSLGAKYKGEKTGKFADAAFFSFGRDKVISAVAGGMVIAKDRGLIEKIEAVRNSLPFPEQKDIRRKLYHPIVTFNALHFYNFFSLGKAIMFASCKFHILDRAYSAEEKNAAPDRDFARRMPNALASIALHQMKLLKKNNRHRIRVAQRYKKNIKNSHVGLPSTSPVAKNIFLWYTITVDAKKDFIKEAGKRGIILGDWFPQAIGPIEVDLEKSGYEKGKCPVAERVSASCVNLPTHHNMHRREIKKVVDFVNQYK